MSAARRRCRPEPGTLRDAAAFWTLGICNNTPYVILLACANEISAGGVGEVYLAAIAPALVCKLTAPYWFRAVPYAARALACAALSASSFVVVALSSRHAPQLAGVGLSSLASGLGEASTLALAGAYPGHRGLLTAWSSGTGFAGVAGYTWVALLHTLGHLSLRGTLLLGTALPAAWLLAQFFLLRPPDAARAANEVQVVAQGGAGDEEDAEVGRPRTPATGEAVELSAGVEGGGRVTAAAPSPSRAGRVPPSRRNRREGRADTRCR